MAATGTVSLPCFNGVATIAQEVYPNFADSSRPISSAEPHSKRDADQTKNVNLLREGTLIPPTTGMILPVGRRWGFAITNPQLLAQQNPRAGKGSAYDQGAGNTANLQSSNSQQTRIGITNVATAGRQFVQIIEIEQRNDAAVEAPTQVNNAKRQPIILAENLMLQRIVEAVVADPADDHWTISGEITEFRNQNRLRIHTAQRTNQN